MLEYILTYENDLFFLINGTHTYFLDCLMWLFSGFNVVIAYSRQRVFVISTVILSYIVLFSFFSEFLITFLSGVKVW